MSLASVHKNLTQFSRFSFTLPQESRLFLLIALLEQPVAYITLQSMAPG